MTIAVVTACSPDRFDRLRSQHTVIQAHVPHALHVVVVLASPMAVDSEARRASSLLAAGGGDYAVIAVAHDNHGRVHLARARNNGADLAAERDAQLIIFLDVDCLPGAQMARRYATISHGEVALGPVTYLSRDDGDPPSDALTELTHPHPARPFPPDGSRQYCPQGHYPRYFWSLSVATTADTWRTMRRTFGGFDQGYTGYGAEDTDMGRQLEQAGIPLVLLGGAHAYHRYHPVSSPPIEHLDDILRNGRRYAQRWGHWPMQGWLDAFAERGLIRREGEHWVRTTVSQVAASE